MKKGLKNFLSKQKNKASNPTANATADEAEKKVATDEPKEVAVDPVQPKAVEKKTAAKQESSDEEDDDLAVNVAYGNIAEEEEKAVTQADDESKNTNAFTMEEEKKPEDAPKKEKKERANASNITFGGGKPRFGRGARAVIANDDGELADLLDQEPSSKKKAKKETEMLTRQAMAQKQEAPQAEEKKEPGMQFKRPTFRGKLNLKGAGADNNDSGVKTNYGFEVKYRTEFNDGSKKEGDEKPEVREKKSKRLGQQITVEEAERQEAEPRTVDEDGFELTGAGNDRKARRQLGQMQNANEDDGFKIVRNDKRGGAFAAMNQ